MHLYLVTNPYTTTANNSNNNAQQDGHGVIKVGYMSDRRPERILSRYKTYYGSNTTVMCWKCSNAARLEQQFKTRFVAERVELELYDARFVVRYVHWITTTTRTAPIVCTGTFMPERVMPERVMPERIMPKRIMPERIMPERIMSNRGMSSDPLNDTTTTIVEYEPVGSRTRGRRIQSGPIGWRTRSRNRIR